MLNCKVAGLVILLFDGIGRTFHINRYRFATFVSASLATHVIIRDDCVHWMLTMSHDVCD